MTNLLMDEERWVNAHSKIFICQQFIRKIPIIYSMPSDMVIDENVTINIVIHCSNFPNIRKVVGHCYINYVLATIMINDLADY